MRGTPDELVVAAAERERGGQRAERGAGVAEEELGRASPGSAPPTPCTRSALGAASRSMRTPSVRKRLEHHARVVGVEQRRRASSCPRASAASSSTRLEMLFEPGSAHRARGARATRREVERARALIRSTARAARARRQRLRAPRAPRANSALERRAVAAVDQLRASTASVAPIAVELGAAARRDWRAQMSRHISGRARGDAREVAKAAAGVAEQLARRRGARASSRDQREGEQVRQVADTAAKIAVVRARRRASITRAPQRLPQRRARASSACGAVSGSGVSTTRAASEQRRRTPPPRRSSRVPAIGCAGHEVREARAEAPRARRATTSRLVLPASVTTASGAERAARWRANTARDLARPAPRPARGRRPQLARPAASSARRDRSTPRASASSRLARVAADADDRAAPRRRACSASANEPPIRPTPTTASLPMCTAVRRVPSALRARAASAARKRSFSSRQARR